jgi:hypothetical protein
MGYLGRESRTEMGEWMMREHWCMNKLAVDNGNSLYVSRNVAEPYSDPRSAFCNALFVSSSRANYHRYRSICLVLSVTQTVSVSHAIY